MKVLVSCAKRANNCLSAVVVDCSSHPLWNVYSNMEYIAANFSEEYFLQCFALHAFAKAVDTYLVKNRLDTDHQLQYMLRRFKEISFVDFTKLV